MRAHRHGHHHPFNVQCAHQEPRPPVPLWLETAVGCLQAQRCGGPDAHRCQARVPEQGRELAAVHRPHPLLQPERLQVCREQPRAGTQYQGAQAVGIL